MRTNCENCVGETRIACDAVFAGVRESTGLNFRTVLELDDNDVMGQMALHDSAAKKGIETRQKLAELGCTLEEAALMRSLVSELSAGMLLTAAELDEEAEQEEREREARINALLAEARSITSDVRTTLSSLIGVELKDDSSETDSGDLFGDLSKTREIIQQATAVFKADKENQTKQATEEYCAQNNWDPENLSFAQRMDVRTHLRQSGLID